MILTQFRVSINLTPIILTVIACKQADKQPKFIFKFISDSRCWNLYLTMLNGWTNGNSFIRLNNIRFSSLYNGDIYPPLEIYPPLVKYIPPWKYIPPGKIYSPPGKIKSTRKKEQTRRAL